MRKGTQILDLHGNIFRVKSEQFQLCLDCSDFSELIFTKDLNSDEIFDLGINHPSEGETNYYYISYNKELDVYYVYPLKLIGYDETSDIRMHWKYAHRRKH